VLKVLGIIAAAALLFSTGCSTPRRPGIEPVPREWSFTPPTNPPAASPLPALPQSTVGRNTPPPVQISRPAAQVTWTSLTRWAAEQQLAAPRIITRQPVANYALSSTNGTMTLVIGSRTGLWQGMEVFLGFAPEMIDGQIFVHGLDLKKNLEPLLLGSPLTLGTNRVLVIDPGHGGSSSGTRNLKNGRLEKEFTLDWARRIQSLLATNGWTVLLTRTNDEDMTLSNRVAFAAEHQADAFISLHFNSAAPSTVQSGVETYCLTPVGMPSTLTRGYSDNWDDQYPNNAFDLQNLQLAVLVQKAVLRAGGSEDRGVRRARFMTVLQGQKCPAALVEGGFLSNPDEAAKIEDPKFRQKLAEAVATIFK